MIPQTFAFSGQEIHTLHVFGVVAFVLGWFLVWRESRKDSFNHIYIFDQFILAYAIAISAYLFTPLKMYGIFPALLVVYLYAKKLKWSIYRLLDILALSASLVSLILAVGNFFVFERELSLFFAIFNLFFLCGAVVYRNRLLKSGYSFSMFLILFSVFGFLADSAHENLIFYVCLVTLSTVVVGFRIKRNMATNLPKGLLEFFREKLVHKEKRLAAEQKLLIEEDNQIKEAGSQDNSEETDEAVLEDVRKEEFDNRKNIVASMLTTVRKALGLIKVGKYGICEVCGKPIDKARLRAIPEATTCLEHAK